MDVGSLAGLEEANAALDAIMAADAAPPNSPPDSANPEPRAAQPDEPAVPVQPETITDTPTAAESPTQVAETEASLEVDATGKPPEPTTPPTKPESASKFAKDAARRDTSWKAINAEKQAHAQAVAQFKAEQSAWQRERELAEVSTEVTPDKYTDYAARMRMQSDHLKAEAQRLEQAGEYDAAEAKREEARDCEADIRKATKAAEELRKNPPPDKVARVAQIEAQKKEWTLKAATDFPELAKQGSALQQGVADGLRDLQANAPAMLRDPKSIYFVTKLVAAEAAAARVPAMEKELGQMQARVKELEALTSPSDAGQPVALNGQIPFEQRSRADQFAELEQMAQGLMLR